MDTTILIKFLEAFATIPKHWLLLRSLWRSRLRIGAFFLNLLKQMIGQIGTWHKTTHFNLSINSLGYTKLFSGAISSLALCFKIWLLTTKTKSTTDSLISTFDIRLKFFFFSYCEYQFSVTSVHIKGKMHF